MSLTLSLDFQYTTSIEKLWVAMTDSNKLSKWIAENDFKAVVGHRFQFRTQPVGGWNGVIEGEVLVVKEPHELSYTWGIPGEEHTITWTLRDLENGQVNLHLEQTGISNAQGLKGAEYGWGKWSGELEKVLANL